jgi:hypothetical protein
MTMGVDAVVTLEVENVAEIEDEEEYSPVHRRLACCIS